MNYIANAVEPLRQEAIEDARAYAGRLVAMVERDLIAAGMDMNMAAPRPHGHMSRASYQQAQARVQLFAMLTKRTETNTYGMRAPRIVTMDAAAIEVFYNVTEADASAQFDAYVAKLTGKVGEHAAAELHGDHVWSYSVVRVTKPDGSVELWKTQRIVNTSKLGKVFNQYPTRKIK